MSKLYLIRGLPGSGKSTLAKNLLNSFTAYRFEADMYFVDDYGNYNFDANKLRFAHEWCKEQTRKHLDKDDTVIVSNTFTTIKELKPYFEIAKEFGITPIVIHCQNQFQNVHNVPEETLIKMKARWCNDLTPLFESLK